MNNSAAVPNPFRLLPCLAAIMLGCACAAAKTQPPSQSGQPAAAPAQLSTTPVSREGLALQRQNEALQRARDGYAEIVFLGDSITQGWESAPDQWKSMIGNHTAVNLGVGGDRTEHVLWRLEQAPLTRLNPQIVVLMIGTNNANRDSCEDIMIGIRAIADLIIKQCPNTEVLVLDIPPRGRTTNDMRGKITQINQALARGGWPAHARFVRIGDEFVQADGTIDAEIMPDFLHFSPRGYAMWGASIKRELDHSFAGQHPVTAPGTP